MRNIEFMIANAQKELLRYIPAEISLSVEELLFLNRSAREDKEDRWAELILKSWLFGFACATDFYKYHGFRADLKQGGGKQ